MYMYKYKVNFPHMFPTLHCNSLFNSGVAWRGVTYGTLTCIAWDWEYIEQNGGFTVMPIEVFRKILISSFSNVEEFI